MTLDCVCFESCDTASDDERELCYLTPSCVSSIGWGGYKAGDGGRERAVKFYKFHNQNRFNRNRKLLAKITSSILISLLKDLRYR